MSALTVSGLCKAFGGLHVTSDVNLNVEPGERRLIIGPNGAGKTTLFNLITGEITPDKGSIHLFGRTSPGAEPASAHLGMARTYQIITLFAHDTIIHTLRWPCSACRRCAGTRYRHQASRPFQSITTRGARRRPCAFAARPMAQASYGERRRGLDR